MYKYRAKIVSVYDADGSYQAIIDLGFGFEMTRKLRLHGVDSPELRGNQKEAGIVARDYVRGLILGKDVIVKTHRDATGKYGRIMSDIDIDGMDLAKDLISRSMAKPYFGDKKEEWTPEELSLIVRNK